MSVTAWPITPPSGDYRYRISPEPAIVDPVRNFEIGVRACPGYIPERAIQDEASDVSFKTRGSIASIVLESIETMPEPKEADEFGRCFTNRYSYRIDLSDGYIFNLIGNDGRYKLATAGYTLSEVDHDEVNLWGVFRGENPSRDVLSAYLGTDICRAICWKESTWEQFRADGLPKKNINPNGTIDWGLMAINEASVHERWHWKHNVDRGKSSLADKKVDAKTYLDKHGNYTADMLQNETIQRYNGGVYYRWNDTANQWVISPPPGNRYVELVTSILAARPWEHP